MDGLRGTLVATERHQQTAELQCDLDDDQNEIDPRFSSTLVSAIPHHGAAQTEKPETWSKA